jgi:small neutral amino acid transporter SnatA (MarC family)
MLETAVVSFTTFFATIGPIDVVVMFAALGISLAALAVQLVIDGIAQSGLITA